MQGRKQIVPQLFYRIRLEGLVPQDNFYRRLNEALDVCAICIKRLAKL
jgi:hypothetical protein